MQSNLKILDLKNFLLSYNPDKLSNFQIGIAKSGNYYIDNLDYNTVDKMIKFLKEYKKLYRKEIKNG